MVLEFEGKIWYGMYQTFNRLFFKGKGKHYREMFNCYIIKFFIVGFLKNNTTGI